jgi:hypothetical protein
VFAREHEIIERRAKLEDKVNVCRRGCTSIDGGIREITQFGNANHCEIIINISVIRKIWGAE